MWWLVIPAAWLFLVLFWGGFWRADQRLERTPDPTDWPEVVAVIPARNEAETIAGAVEAHRATGYPGGFRVIVADDGSSDATGALARQAGADVIDVPPLPEGWSGKLWALHNGLAHAGPGAGWVLLTDADIHHAPSTLRRLVAFGEANGLALVSLMARLDARGFWGSLLVPAFIFFFQKLYPFPWVNRPGHWCAAAAGGCMLVRREALAEVGGVAAIRGALIDDCALAAKIKHGPPRRTIWLGLADNEVVSLRDNRSFGSIWNMVARTAFTQLRHSAWLLAGAVLGMLFLYVGPLAALIVGAVTGDWAAMGTGLAALALMGWAYYPTIALYRQPAWRVCGLLLAAPLYTAMTAASALRHWRGRGGRWKGRTYP